MCKQLYFLLQSWGMFSWCCYKFYYYHHHHCHCYNSLLSLDLFQKFNQRCRSDAITLHFLSLNSLTSLITSAIHRSLVLPLLLLASSWLIETFLGISSYAIHIACPAHLHLDNLICVIIFASLQREYTPYTTFPCWNISLSYYLS